MSTQLSVVGEMTTAVSTQVRGYVSEGTLAMPANYSAENALKAAMLMLPEIKDANKVPVLKACTQESIKGALLSMCVQGLNPDKKQCYFIPYGEKLTLSRSYLGDIAVVKNGDPSIDDIYAAAVFEKDDFTYTIKRGIITEVQHGQKMENKDGPIVAAYATVLYKDGREVSTVMTWEQIKQSWKQSQTKPVNADGTINQGSTHGKYPEEMAKKTVVRRACKSIIGTLNDSSLFAQAIREAANTSDAAEVEQEISENANAVVIECEFTEVPDHDPATGEVIGGDPF